VRKLIEFDDEMYQAIHQLGQDRMATLQDLADEAFADLLKKHDVPIDLRDALRKSVKAQDSKPRTKRTLAK
jgi:non-homologous end joining protein Ku